MSTITVTAKIQIYFSNEKDESLKITTNAYRKACNWLSKQIFKIKKSASRARIATTH